MCIDLWECSKYNNLTFCAQLMSIITKYHIWSNGFSNNLKKKAFLSVMCSHCAVTLSINDQRESWCYCLLGSFVICPFQSWFGELNDFPLVKIPASTRNVSLQWRCGCPSVSYSSESVKLSGLYSCLLLHQWDTRFLLFYWLLISLCLIANMCLLPLQLTNTKSHDNRTTLLHYLVDTIDKNFPHLNSFLDELYHVDKAARGNVKQVTGDLFYH